MTVRTTEQVAPETLAGLLAELAQLTIDQPTTAELEEALNKLPTVAACLRTWISSRHIIQANAGLAAVFSDRHPQIAAIVCNTPEEDAAMDLLEAQSVERAHVHPIFAPLVEGMRRPA